MCGYILTCIPPPSFPPDRFLYPYTPNAQHPPPSVRPSYSPGLWLGYPRGAPMTLRWALVPKADGSALRFVQDASPYTFSLHSRPLHLLPCPTLHRHLWRLCQALMDLDTKYPNTSWAIGEADGRSYFYQWPVGPLLGNHFILDIQGSLYRMVVLYRAGRLPPV